MKIVFGVKVRDRERHLPCNQKWMQITKQEDERAKVEQFEKRIWGLAKQTCQGSPKTGKQILIFFIYPFCFCELVNRFSRHI
jgi:hypothetical protein